ncbi:phage tail protein [Salmonella enterica subsp. enterica]|nr:phage tail protein [Salmonella enterica subsp. enterica serovar Jangwani]EAY0274968.1 phage tail protein [Salmonella enterica]EBG6786649.1 phage tail protein [Salmonella enterica subsp. enterica]ECD5539702.1 phage tail protein [Salmonella enterica subsp. enterica serovar Kokomlemle]ECE7267187.1 phage tail protein [Salmonella enterica subsp. enterica serovar Johannesburg]ECN4752390.1 phage tail protein [Salmonella enterica subsp. enterica serovar Heidelberg]ECY4323975.1 phage tail protein [
MATGNRLSTEIMINLAGNLTAKARQYGANMSQFARNHQKAMRLVKATTEAATRGLDTLGNRYTAMIAGIGSSLTVKQIADFDAQMRRMGTDAQLTTEQVKTLHDKIRDVSNQKDIRIDASALGQGASELLGKTGDYQYVVDNLRNMGLMMQAFGVDGQVAAGLMAQFWEKGVRGANAVSNMMDRLYAQFAVGSVSVADVARAAPKLFSIIQDQGPEAIAQMGAFAQVFAKNKGSIDETVTSIQAMYASLSDKKNIEFLKKNGVDVFVKGTKDIKKPYELMMEILKRAKYDQLKLQDVFDQTGMQGIKALLSPENRKLMEQMIYGTIDPGATQKAAATNAEGFNAALQSLNNEWQRFAEGQLAKPVQDLADALNSVDQNTVQNWLQVGKYMAIALGGIIAIRKTYQFGKTIHDIMNPKGKGKGIPGGITDVFGSGVMPVYVVNMGKGSPGNNNTDSLPDTRTDKPGKDKTQNSRLVTGQVAAGLNYLDMLTAVFPETQEEREALITKVQANNNRPTVWTDIKNWFNSLEKKNIADPRPWAGMQSTQNYPFLPQQLQGEIRVVVEGDARVKSVKVDQPGVRLSAQAGITSVEQG